VYKFFLFLTLLFSTLYSDFLQVKSSISRVNDFEFKMPSDEIVTIPKETKIIIVTFEKETGKFVNSYLDEQDATYLQMHKAVFIADISKMPTFFVNIVALPKLKKYKHLLYINYNKGFDTVVPSKEDSATLLFIEDSKIKEIRYISTQQELKEAIEK